MSHPSTLPPRRPRAGARPVLVLAAILGTSAASAAPVPVQVRDGDGGSVFSGNGLGTPPVVKIKVDGVAKSVYAGPFALQYRADPAMGWTDFLTYCMEPDELLGIAAGAVHAGTLVARLADTADYGAAARRVGRLWRSHAADARTTATKAAAFQVALWELAYDEGSNLAGGRFSLLSGGAVATQAGTYLNAGAWVAEDRVGAILRNGVQDLIIDLPEPVAVSEPAGVAFFSLGLGVLGFAAWRRRIV